MTSPVEQNAIVDLLFRLADDELLMGHRNSEWTGVAPMIEEDIAFSSMAQDEMGHAQAYYTILHEQLGQNDPDKLAFLRNPKEFRNAHLASLPRTHWAEAIMRQFLYDTAEQIRLEAYVKHPFEPLGQLARKIHGEEKYHFLHARAWILRLGQAVEDSNQRLQEALDQLWPYALGLFESPAHDQPEPFDEKTLKGAWLDLVCPLLVEANLIPPATQGEGQWISRVDMITGRYAPPAEHRIELLDAMQLVYRLDPTAEW